MSDLSLFLKNPKQALIELDKMDCRGSLAVFLRMAWPTFDPSDYIHNWHIDCIADHLMAAGNKEFGGKHLLINIPPRHAKSSIVSVAWHPWEWARGNAHYRFMATSYKEPTAIRDGARAREIIRSKWYQDRFGDQFQIRSGADQKTRYENTRQGYRLCVSTEGVMGEGGDFIIFDDPHNVQKAESQDVREKQIDLITMALPTRLNNSWGCPVTVMQRLHERDYSGHILASDYDNVIHVCLPARYEHNHPYPVKTPLEKWTTDPRQKDGEPLWNARYDDDGLRALEDQFVSRHGSYVAAGQLQQRPAPREGGLFKREMFGFVQVAPDGVEWCRGWDLAASEARAGSNPAFTAGVKLGRRKDDNDTWIYYIAGSDRVQGSPATVNKLIKSVAERDGYGIDISIPQDPGQAAISQKKQLASLLSGWNVRFSPESGDKVQRAEPVSAQAEAGNVKFVRSGPKDDAWIDPLLSELCDFPNGAHKDQVDALSRAFLHLISKRDKKTTFVAPKIVSA